MKVNLSNLTQIFHLQNEGLKETIQEGWRDKKVRYFVLSSAIINILGWAVSIFLNFRIDEKIIPLHHNIYFGISLIGSPKQIYFIPLLGLILILINLIFSYLVKQKDNFFVYLFTASSILINFFLLLGLGSIILINFR